jgi:hypothetical protein
MNGWPAVAIMIALQIAVAAFLMRGTAMAGLPRDRGFNGRTGSRSDS